jgi:hypothetical protein
VGDGERHFEPVGRASLRPGLRVDHLGDERLVLDSAAGIVHAVRGPAVAALDQVLEGRRPIDDEVLAALVGAGIAETGGLTRREALALSTSALIFIASTTLPSAAAAASTGVLSITSDSDGGVVMSSVVVDDEGTSFDLYEIRLESTQLGDNATITRTLTLASSTTASLVLVGGGGGGGGFADPAFGRAFGGGGGAGEVVVRTDYELDEGTYVISIGAGGSGGFNSAGSNGVGSSVRRDGAGTDLLFARGGGGGGGAGGTPTSGGSGGGRASSDASSDRVDAGAEGVLAEGTSFANAGGLSGAVTDGAGGGGGAGATGGDAAGGTGGTGGVGHDVGSVVRRELLLAFGGGGSGQDVAGVGRGSGVSEGRGARIDGPVRVSAQPGLNGTGDGGGGGLVEGNEGAEFGRRGGSGVLFLRIPR